MYEIILFLHIIICCVLVGLILLQQGKGASMGSGFGGGASQTVFGSQGSGSFLLRLTGGIAAVFFATNILLGSMLSSKSNIKFKPIIINQTEESPVSTQKDKENFDMSQAENPNLTQLAANDTSTSSNNKSCKKSCCSSKKKDNETPTKINS